MRKTFTIVLKIIFSVYFLFIIFIQVYDQNFFESEKVGKIKNKYALPFFEQNWGMFSPNPPMGNHYFLVKFESGNIESDYIDIHKKVREKSFNSLFSIDQRIIKYFAECYNDIVRKKSKNINIEKNIHSSHGLESILNYSKIVLNNQRDFLEKTSPNDSVFVKIYLIDEQLNKDIYKDKTYTKSFIELDRIYLTTTENGK
ncbi:DUF5819 family protein [Weeksella virosa]|uniref:Uncharacterized protein n=1 Tax=Weeksella virosa (strain ATCC 43766 / DSM 16922 / JCM 21250 / CCUG 30538 / CDC 9751 / IAM 14551 / NBRC 16016 / NCTC 11634 / CL345/78) TaxID=865938 RepID=F0NY66_WEEVC|nr:DUF5819 family protein [Weeksella virosa]ADX67057.1 hypothetical protein Weevi_0337 [Weeksella virosa DSM 16922]SUP53325.1 Uncharacterised protein [Weeksella virosa]VEH63208.1 Uncharacterised protein [Weeksella virosa]